MFSKDKPAQINHKRVYQSRKHNTTEVLFPQVDVKHREGRNLIVKLHTYIQHGKFNVYVHHNILLADV